MPLASAVSLDPLEEEVEPLLPGAAQADALQQLVVALPVPLEEQAEIEERLAPGPPRRTAASVIEQSADAAVAVEERVDGLELDVRQACLDQNGQAASSSSAGTARARPGSPELVRGGGGTNTALPGRRAADPVLAAAELAGRLVGAAPMPEQDRVDLPDQPQATAGSRRAAARSPCSAPPHSWRPRSTSSSGTPGASSTSNSRRSDSEDCVPSICEESTASLRT